MNKDYFVQLNIQDDFDKHIGVVKLNETDSVTLNINLVQNGKPFDLSTANYVTMAIIKPDTNFNNGYCEIVDGPAGKIKYTLPTNCVNQTGVFRGEVQAFNNTSMISTAAFSYEVKNSLLRDEGVTTQPEYPILVELINEVQEAVIAEVGRVSAENGRVSAESSRVTAETGRASSESTRVSNENTRKSQETSRVNAESSRATAETGRVNAESARVSAENTRVSQESTRQTNESNRSTAESGRATAESNRVTAENARVSAENSRASAESTRQSNESTRQTQEANRVSSFADIYQQYLDSISSGSVIEVINARGGFASLDARLDRIDNKSVPITVPLSFTQTTITKQGAEPSYINATITPKSFTNPLGRLGNFGKDSNSDGVADGWSGFNAGTYSLSNGEQTFTPTAQFGGISTTIQLVVGKKYVMCVNAKSSDNVNISFNGDEYGKNGTGTNAYEKIGCIGTAISSYTVIRTLKPSSFTPITVKECYVINVTDDYPELLTQGLTNQQILDWLLANTSYADSIAVTKNPSVKVVGENLFSGDIELGIIDGSGIPVPSTNRIRSSYFTRVKGSQTITWSNDKAYQIITLAYDENKQFISTSTTQTVILPINCAYIKFRTGFDGQNDLTVKIMLNEGTIAKPYQPYWDTQCYIDSDFLTGDEPKVVNGQVEGNKLWSSKKVLYGKDYNIIFNTGFTGYKRFFLASTWKDSDGAGSSKIMQKYDGSMIQQTSDPSTAANQFDLQTNGNLFITVANTDSGGTDGINFTDDEAKALFNGWKKTGASTWVSAVDLTTVPTTQSIDFVKANIAPNYEGYQMYYKFNAPKLINKDSDSYLAPLKGDVPMLKQGVNTVVFDTGVVLGESVVPNTNTPYAYINATGLSQLKNPVEYINAVKTNGNVDSLWNWVFGYDKPRGNGIVRKDLTAFDPSATYTVDYEILDSLAPQIGSCSASYSEGLVDSVSGLYEAMEARQEQSVTLDTITNLAMYEKQRVKAISWHLEGSGTRLYVIFVVNAIPKLTRPIISSKILNFMSNEIDYTNQLKLLSVASDTELNNNSRAIYILTYYSLDSAIISNVKNHGFDANIDVTLDCRGVI